MKKLIIPIIVALFIITVTATNAIAVDVSKNQIQINSEQSSLGTGYISGIITDSSGNPKENAQVVAFAFGIIGGPAVALSSTSSDGSYTCAVPAGRYHVISFKFGDGVAFASPVEVKSGQTTHLDLSLTGGLIPGATSTESQELTATKQTSLTPTAGTGIITGTITSQNGQPIAFVRVIAVGSPNDPNAQTLGFTITHLLLGGKGVYTMRVQAGRYLFVRAAKLPFYIGAWAGPIIVGEGETTNLDLSITYIGPGSMPESQQSQQIVVQQQTLPTNT